MNNLCEKILDIICTLMLLIAVVSIHAVFMIPLAIHLISVHHHYGYTLPVRKMWNQMFEGIFL